MELEEFQKFLGITFNDAELLRQALTHRSYVNEHDAPDLEDNERMEFLGDAVLDFLTGEMLYLRFPNLPEGDLTRLRAALVRNETLARLARTCRGTTLGVQRCQSGRRRRAQGRLVAEGRPHAADRCDQGLTMDSCG